MIGRWWYYFGLGCRDLIRLWSTTQHHVIIVAGICLPILMLLGLKRGHVETLRKDLITSPTGRQVTFWSARKGELMDRAGIERLTSELPAVDVIIPETQRIAALRSLVEGETHEVDSATLYATRPGDPLLSQLGLQSPARGTRGIIIGEGIGQRLSAKVGQSITVILSRGRGDLAESAQVDLQVVGVMPTEELGAAIAYVDLDLLDQFDAYMRGFRVPDFGWASAKTPAPDSYSSYLVFCEPGNDLTDSDRRFLADRGFELVNRTMNPPAPLARLLVSDFAEKLIIYEARTERSEIDPNARLRLAPSELSEATEADDVILPWNRSLSASVASQDWQMVGLSLPRRTWLREYFIEADLAFDYEADPFQGRVTSEPPANFQWPLNADLGVSLSIEAVKRKPADSSPDSDSATDDHATDDSDSTKRADKSPADDENKSAEASQIVVVPANLLAWVAAHAAGQVEYDADVRLFVPIIQSAIYDRARLYATTIDDVPLAVRALAERQFAVMSETGRITEIHRQDVSLQLLVWVVGLGVFLFGIVTVFSVLMDSTDRKRATIGILRVMGMSRNGIFALILVRATVIGAAAAVLSLLCGWGLSLALAWTPHDLAWLQWKPIVTVQLHQMDLSIVAAGAMLCCGFGAIPPAWKASRLDPFDAIVEGRFR